MSERYGEGYIKSTYLLDTNNYESEIEGSGVSIVLVGVSNNCTCFTYKITWGIDQ